MKDKNCVNQRRQIQQEYLLLQNFEGYYRNETFRLWCSYTDTCAYQCFGVSPGCYDFQFFLEYNEIGELIDIRVTYVDGGLIHTVCPYWDFYKQELMELAELPICFGFDEENCDKKWNRILRQRSRNKYFFMN